MIVFAVVYGNYEPYEVASLWLTREAADKEADRLNNDNASWRVIAWAVGEA